MATIKRCILLSALSTIVFVASFERTPAEDASTDTSTPAEAKLNHDHNQETTALLKTVRKNLEELGKQLDTSAEQGKFVDVARVYWTALNWCADDAKRCLEADEIEIAKRAKPLLERSVTCGPQGYAASWAG